MRYQEITMANELSILVLAINTVARSWLPSGIWNFGPKEVFGPGQYQGSATIHSRTQRFNLRTIKESTRPSYSPFKRVSLLFRFEDNLEASCTSYDISDESDRLQHSNP